MIEVWKPVVGLEKTHEISNLGRLRSLPRVCKFGARRKEYPMCILKLHYDKQGYLRCALRIGKNQTVNKFIHRLVAESFGCAEAAKAVGGHKSAIAAVCGGVRKTSKGFQWRYK